MNTSLARWGQPMVPLAPPFVVRHMIKISAVITLFLYFSLKTPVAPLLWLADLLQVQPQDPIALPHPTNLPFLVKYVKFQAGLVVSGHFVALAVLAFYGMWRGRRLARLEREFAGRAVDFKPPPAFMDIVSDSWRTEGDRARAPDEEQRTRSIRSSRKRAPPRRSPCGVRFLEDLRACRSFIILTDVR